MKLKLTLVKAVPLKVRRDGLRGLSVALSIATGAKLGDRLWQYVTTDGTIVMSPRRLENGVQDLGQGTSELPPR